MEIYWKRLAVCQRQPPDATDAFRLCSEQFVKLKRSAHVSTASRLTSAGKNHTRGNGEADEKVRQEGFGNYRGVREA